MPICLRLFSTFVAIFVVSFIVLVKSEGDSELATIGCQISGLGAVFSVIWAIWTLP